MARTKLSNHLSEAEIERFLAEAEMLQHALTSLILKKGYEVITVEDICEAANVG